MLIFTTSCFRLLMTARCFLRTDALFHIILKMNSAGDIITISHEKRTKKSSAWVIKAALWIKRAEVSELKPRTHSATMPKVPTLFISTFRFIFVKTAWAITVFSMTQVQPAIWISALKSTIIISRISFSRPRTTA